MKSRTTRRFRDAFRDLPSEIQQRARQAYARFRVDPNHPGLRFKKVQVPGSIYSVRITKDYRALGTFQGDDVVWFWIGSHEEYARLLAQM